MALETLIESLPSLFEGLGVTLLLTAFSIILGTILGVLLASAAAGAVHHPARVERPAVCLPSGHHEGQEKAAGMKTLADLGIDPAAVGAAGRKVVVKALRLPPQRQAVRMITGETPQGAAVELVRVLHDKAKLI